HRHELRLADAVSDVHVPSSLLGDCRLPRIMLASGRFVVVAHVQPCRGRQLEQPPYRSVERVCAAPGEVRAGRAVVGHEQRVADKDRVADAVRDTCGRVTGRVNDADFEPPDTKRFTIAKQPVELAAIARDVVEVEDTTEDPLNLTNVTEMAALRAGVSPRLQNGVQE